MKRDFNKLANNHFDLVIVGAGAFGSCAAWEAASRGLSVAIVDRGDFCSATSANHLKMVHGGIRYLQHLDIPRVRESCRERSALLRIAPHLVRRVPVIFPTYGHGLEGKEILALGFLFYDLLTLDRNWGLKDSVLKIPHGKIFKQIRCLELFPQLSNIGINGAGVFYDGQFYNPPRLVLAFLRSAVNQGAKLGNYLEVKEFLKKENRIYGIKVHDNLTGNQFSIRAETVLNATGPWTNNLLESNLGINLNPKPRFSRDLGLVVKRKFSDYYALGVRIGSKDPDALLSRKGRHVFLVPWRNYTLVGVWHLPYDMHPDNIVVKKEELQSYLNEVNEAVPALELTFDEISMINTGLTLFGENDLEAKDLSFGKRSILIDHASEHQIEGLITLIGIRATTARGKAKKAVDLIFNKLNRKFVKSKTHELPIFGGEFEKFENLLQEAKSNLGRTLSLNVINSLLHNYGTEFKEVLKYTEEDPSLAEPVGNTSTIKAEVIHAVREEMAVKLGDVIFRRTDLGTGEYPEEKDIRVCATLMGRELGWDEVRTESEIMDLEKPAFLKIK